MQNHTIIIIELGVCASRHPSSEFRKITISSEQIICCFAGRFFAAANLKCCAICTPSGCPRGDAHSQQVASSSNHLDRWFSTDSMIPWSKKNEPEYQLCSHKVSSFCRSLFCTNMFCVFSWSFPSRMLAHEHFKGKGLDALSICPRTPAFHCIDLSHKNGDRFYSHPWDSSSDWMSNGPLGCAHHDISTTSSKLEIHCLFQSDLSHELGRCLHKAYGLLIAENTLWHSTRNQFSSCCKWRSKQNWCLANLNGPPFQQLRHHSIWPSRESNAPKHVLLCNNFL